MFENLLSQPLVIYNIMDFLDLNSLRNFSVSNKRTNKMFNREEYWVSRFERIRFDVLLMYDRDSLKGRAIEMIKEFKKMEKEEILLRKMNVVLLSDVNQKDKVENLVMNSFPSYRRAECNHLKVIKDGNLFEITFLFGTADLAQHKVDFVSKDWFVRNKVNLYYYLWTTFIGIKLDGMKFDQGELNKMDVIRNDKYFIFITPQSEKEAEEEIHPFFESKIQTLHVPQLMEEKSVDFRLNEDNYFDERQNLLEKKNRRKDRFVLEDDWLMLESQKFDTKDSDVENLVFNGFTVAEVSDKRGQFSSIFKSFLDESITKQLELEKKHPILRENLWESKVKKRKENSL